MFSRQRLPVFPLTRRPKAMTLVPIAPPGGRSVKPFGSPELIRFGSTHGGQEASPMKSVQAARKHASNPRSACRGYRLLGNTVSNLGSQTVYCTNTPIVQMLQTLRQLLWPRCCGNGGRMYVIRDGIPARSKGCARQGRTMAEQRQP